MEMKAGRELDALVAEKVMGCLTKWIADRPGRVECGCNGLQHEHFIDPYDRTMDMGLKPYSSSIEAAWEVVEKLCPAEDEFRIRRFEKQEWECTFGYFDGDRSEAETAPLAICLAALTAVGA